MRRNIFLLACGSALVLVVAVAARSQTKLEARDVLAKSGEAYRRLRGLSFKSAVQIELSESDRPTRKVDSTLVATFEKPAKFFVQENPGREDELQVRNDGNKLVTYNPRLKQFIEAPSLTDWGGKSILRQPLRLPIGTSLVLNTLRSENPGRFLSEGVTTVTLKDADNAREGEVPTEPLYLLVLKHRWDKIEKGLSAETLAGLKDSFAEIRLWIDARDFLIRKVQVDLAPVIKQLNPERAPKHFTITETFSDLVTNPRSDPRQFTFSPPAGVRAVQAFREPPAGAEYVGQSVPDLTLRNLKGEQVRLNSFKGKSAMLIVFWSSG